MGRLHVFSQMGKVHSLDHPSPFKEKKRRRRQRLRGSNKKRKEEIIASKPKNESRKLSRMKVIGMGQLMTQCRQTEQ